MVTKYVLPLVAVAGVCFALLKVVEARQPLPASKPLMQPPTTPTQFRAVAGAGLIEARMENIPIGAYVPGVVEEVYVNIHDKKFVKKGDPLFRLDDRSLKAELRVREAMLFAAEAQLHKLKNAPRPEDLPPAEAAVDEARAKLNNAEISAVRSRRLYEQNAGPMSDYDRDRFGAAEARATLAKMEADLDRLKKGTWKEDLLIAEASVVQARSQVEQTKIELDRLTVRALTDGQVLQVNVRPGQFAALAWKEPLIVLGDVNRLHVRVDIDEQDLPYFRPGTKAVATLKGRPQVRFPLEFVKVEPYVVPKKSLTGDNSERVDTRVLQAIYALPDERSMPLYVGQQMDVYLEAVPPPDGISLESTAAAKTPFADPPAPHTSYQDHPAPATR
jgi:multidrug resistance efflux pump